MVVPRLYVIADIDFLAARGVELRDFGEGLRAAGVSLVQLRYKSGSPQQILENGLLLRETLPEATLVMNDRADLATLARFDGVHVGQEDLSVADARSVFLASRAISPSEEPLNPLRLRPRIVGVSTHSADQVLAATDADYVAVGPIFSTKTKLDAEPVVGLAGIRLARSLTDKPIVAIGGISRQNCRSVINAGADCVAVISALLAPDETVENVARDFLSILR